MTSPRSLRGPARPAAVLVRVFAFLVAAASIVAVPSALAAAALGHLAPGTAFMAAGIAVGLTLAAGIAARGLDPLRAA